MAAPTIQQQAQAIDNAAQKYGVPVDVLLGVYGQETDFGADDNTSSAGAMGAFQFIPSTAASYNYPLTNTPDLAQFQQQADASAALLKSSAGASQNWAAAITAYGGGYTLQDVENKAKQAPGALVDDLLGAAAAGTPLGDLSTAGSSSSGGGGGLLSGLESDLGGVAGAAVNFTAGGIPIASAAGGVVNAATDIPSAIGDVANEIGTVGSGIGSVAGTIGDVWTTLTTPKTWLRVAEFVGGAILLYMALKALTGAQGPTINIPKAAVAAEA